MPDVMKFPGKWHDAPVANMLMDALVATKDYINTASPVAFCIVVVSEGTDGQEVFHRSYADTAAEHVGLIGMQALSVRANMLQHQE